MAVALYAVLAYMSWGAAARQSSSVVGSAGARSRAAQGGAADLRRADAGDGAGAVLLDLLVADAVRGAHLRPLHRRPLQRRPAQFPAGGRLAGGGGASRAALYWVLPNLAQFDIKSDVVHGVPVPIGYMAMTGGLRGALHRDAAGDCRRWSSRGGTSSNVTSRSPAAVVATAVARRAAAGRRRRSCRRRASARYPPAADEADASLYLQSGTGAAAVRRRIHRAVRRHLLDPRDPVLRRRQAAHRCVGAASRWSRRRRRRLPRTRFRCSIRCSTSRRPSIRGSTSRTASARSSSAKRIRAAPERPDLAIALLEKGLEAQPEKWQYMQDIGFVHYWFRHDFHGRGRLVQARRATCPARRGGCARWRRRRWRRAAIGDRRARCGWRLRETRRDRLAAQGRRRRLLQLQALDAIDALQRAARRLRRSAPASAATWQRWCSARVLRGVPLDPTGTPLELSQRPRRSCRSRRRCGRRRTSRHPPAAPPVMIETVPPLFGLIAAGAFGAIVGSFLNVCIHRLPRDASIVWPSSACPHCERELSWYENIPVLSWLVLRGALPHLQGADQRPLSVRRGADRGDVRRRVVVLRAGHAAGLAARVRLRADRAVRHRSRASSAAAT